MVQKELTVQIHREDGAFWAQVVEYPGCFAAGDTIEELIESLDEALSLVLGHKVTGVDLGEEPENREESSRQSHIRGYSASYLVEGWRLWAMDSETMGSNR